MAVQELEESQVAVGDTVRIVRIMGRYEWMHYLLNREARVVGIEERGDRKIVELDVEIFGDPLYLPASYVVPVNEELA